MKNKSSTFACFSGFEIYFDNIEIDFETAEYYVKFDISK